MLEEGPATVGAAELLSQVLDSSKRGHILEGYFVLVPLELIKWV